MLRMCDINQVIPQVPKTPWTFENDHCKILYLNDMRLIDEQN